MPDKYFSWDYEPSFRSTKQRVKSFLPTSRHQRSQAESSHHHQYSESLHPPQPRPHHHESDRSSAHSSQHQRSFSTSTTPATSRSSTANSAYAYHSHPTNIRDACLKAQEISPTSDVAEWAHQMHLQQHRNYWWCQGCFPKTIVEPLEIPQAVERVIENRRRVRIIEPTHAYD